MADKQARAETKGLRMGVAPEPGEQLDWIYGAVFATGIAEPVRGQRWFRDFARHDIEPLLEQAGWPRRRPAAPQEPPGAAGKVGRGVAAAVQYGAMAVFSLAGGGKATPDGEVATMGVRPDKKAMNPADERDDFPVLWADQGTVARSLPWQLDPSRRPDGVRTLVILTSHRVAVTAILGGKQQYYVPAEVKQDLPRRLLWQVPRDRLAKIEQCPYSVNREDFRLRFTDGSWVRLHEEYNERQFKEHPRALLAPPDPGVADWPF